MIKIYEYKIILFYNIKYMFFFAFEICSVKLFLIIVLFLWKLNVSSETIIQYVIATYIDRI